MTASNPQIGVEALRTLRAEVLEASALHGSYDHGERHWRAVAHAGLELAAANPRVDPLTVFLFALFHDAMRENEYIDPDHGLRGGELARRLLQGRLDTGAPQVLYEACRDHTEPRTSEDPTTGACWDADRLNLWRVGITPAPRLLSTAEARDPELIRRAKAFHDSDYDWDDLARRAIELALLSK